jgi:peptidoglycan hydrolase-like protein with peptidoglycan-binding domain
MDKLIFFVLALYALATRGRSPSWTTPAANADEAQARADRAAEEAERARQAAEAARRAEAAPKAWPVATPTGLPPFPSGWEYDEPVSAAVRQRAWQLLNELWAKGDGSTKVELTAGNWTTYRAEMTKGNKRGVVAYRVKRGAIRAVPAAAPKRASAPNVVKSPGLPQKVSTPAPLTTSSPPPAPGGGLPPVDQRPLLVQGAGMGGLTHLQPWVKLVQRKLHLTPVDGKFGGVTRAAVETLQRKRTKTPDGKVGPLTWAQLDQIHDPAALTAWNLEVGPAQMAS